MPEKSTTSMSFPLNLTSFCLGNCDNVGCPGCGNMTGGGVYLMLNSSQCTSMTQNQIHRCASFATNPPFIDISRLHVALSLNYAIVALSILSFLLMYNMYTTEKWFSWENMRAHNVVMCTEAALSAATFALITMDGGFAPFLGSLLSSGCYSTETVLSLVSLSSGLASATTLAVITLVIEILEPLESVPFFMASKPTVPLFFVGMSALSLTAVGLELSALMSVVDQSLLFYGRLHNPAYASYSNDQGVSNALCVTYVPSLQYPNSHVFLVNNDMDIPFFLDTNYPSPQSSQKDAFCTFGPMDTSFLQEIISFPIPAPFHNAHPFKIIRCPTWGMLTLLSFNGESSEYAELRLRSDQYVKPRSVVSSSKVLHMNCATRQVLLLMSFGSAISVQFSTLDGGILSALHTLTLPGTSYSRVNVPNLSQQFVDCGDTFHQVCFLYKIFEYDYATRSDVLVQTHMYVVLFDTGFTFLRMVPGSSPIRSALYLESTETSFDVKDAVSGLSVLAAPIPRQGWPPVSSTDVPQLFDSSCWYQSIVFKNDSWFVLSHVSGEFTSTLPVAGHAFNVSFGTPTMYMFTTTDVIFLPRPLNAGEIVGISIGCFVVSCYLMACCLNVADNVENNGSMKVFNA